PSARRPVSAARCPSSKRPATPQMTNCTSDTAPTPSTLPRRSWNGVIELTSTSTTRDVFSSMTEPITCTPYSSKAMYKVTIMKYASENDCPAVSPVVRPPAIFWVRSDTLSCACATTCGSTPARSRRAFSAKRLSASRSRPMSSIDETFAARYSAVPASNSESDTRRKPSIRFASTSPARESSTPGAPAMRRTTTNPRVEARPEATAAPRSVVVRSTTTRRLTPPLPERSTGARNTAAKNIGPSMAITQNDLCRTRSVNSRRTTAQTLRTGARSAGHGGRPRPRPHEIDEDLVQRRLLQLELRKPRARRHEPLEDLLRVSARLELQLGILPVVVDLAHKTFICKHLRGSAKAAVEPDDEMLSAMCPLDVR